MQIHKIQKQHLHKLQWEGNIFFFEEFLWPQVVWLGVDAPTLETSKPS